MWITPRLRILLAYLRLHREAPQSRAQLAFLLRPETSETQAHTNLRNLLHHLRNALPNAELYIERVRTHTLQWKNNTPFILDVDNFNAALLVFLTCKQDW